MVEIQNKLDYAHAIADWFLELGDGHIHRGNFEDALKCNFIAGEILASQNRDLVSVRIEWNSSPRGRPVSETRHASTGRTDQDRAAGTMSSRRERSFAGGRAYRDGQPLDEERLQRTGSQRGVAFTGNTGAHFAAAGGRKLRRQDSYSRPGRLTGGPGGVGAPAGRRGRQLRRSSRGASRCDLRGGLGVTGGPPVMLVNHSAHAFWSGASTADQVVNCRGSALEVFWSATYRGVGLSRCAIVPIPLLDPKFLEGGEKSKPELKRQSRQTLGVAPDAIVILTVGPSFKYLPIEGLDFLEISEEIVKAVPEAVVLAVGFDGDQRWKDASVRMGNRIRTLGAMPHSQLLKVQDAADLYVEAFPFGTTTSLLEAGLEGIPVGLAPAQAAASIRNRWNCTGRHLAAPSHHCRISRPG